MNRIVASVACIALLTLALPAGAVKLPPAPELGEWSWTVDREALPALSLRVFHIATTLGKDKHMVDGGTKDDRIGPVSAYVIEHPKQGLILIDTGYGRVTAESIKDYPGKRLAKIVKLEMKTPLADRLGDISKAPEDVRHVILTHLHADHAGGIADFGKAMLWADGREIDAGLKKGMMKGYNKKAYKERSFDRVDFDQTEAYGPFPQHVDLFDDGSIILLPAPGHTRGSMMVLVNLKSGSFLFLGDAAWVDENWQKPVPKGPLPRTFIEDNWKTNMDGLWRVNTWHKRHPGLVVVAGHEVANMQRLRKWPTAYQ